MSKNDSLSKITTILGLVFEGLSVFTLFFISRLLLNLPQSFIDVIHDENLPASQEAFLFDMFQFLGIVMTVLAVITLIAFLINQYLFRKVFKQDTDLKTKKGIFVYQAVWGGINIAYNTLIGVLYLISSIYALNKISDESNQQKREN